MHLAQTYSGLAEGSHTFTVRATDPAGNTDPSPASRTWTVDLQVADTTPPTVALTAPADGAPVRGSVTISATAEDDTAIDHVDFLVNDVVVGSDSTNFPYSTSWDSTSLADGPATITAIAVDTSGNRTTSASRTVTVDNTAPDTTIDTGPSGIATSDIGHLRLQRDRDRLDLRLHPRRRSADGVHLAPDVQRAGRGLAHVHRPGDRPGRQHRPEPGQPDLDGRHDAARHDDRRGADGHGRFRVGQLRLQRDRDRLDLRLHASTADRSTACTSPKTYSGLAEGSHTFTVRATDPAGNTDPSPASRTWTVDTTPPDTTIDAGPSGIATSDTATFAFSATETGSTFGCTLDGGAADAVHLAPDVQRPGRGLAHVHRPGDRPGRQHRPEPGQPDLDRRPAGWLDALQ